MGLTDLAKKIEQPKPSSKEASIRSLRESETMKRLDMIRAVDKRRQENQNTGAKLKSETEKDQMAIVTTKTKKTNAKKSAKRATVKAATKPVAKAAKPAKVVRDGSKQAIIENLIKRPGGCTKADVLAATDWPSVNMNRHAKAAGIKLAKVKGDDGVLHYSVAA